MDDKVDFRLKILGRYRQGTPREQFNLWFGHPGLREGFDALDLDLDNGAVSRRRPILMSLNHEDVPRSGVARGWSHRVRAGLRGRRPGSSPGAASVGSGRGR